MSNTAEEINELWYTFTKEYYKTMKKSNNLQLHSTTRITKRRSNTKEYIKFPKHTTLNYMDISGAYGCAHQSSKTIKKARKEMVTK